MSKHKKVRERTVYLVLFELANGHFKNLSICQTDPGKSQIVSKNLKHPRCHRCSTAAMFISMKFISPTLTANKLSTRRKTGPLRDGDVRLFIHLFVCRQRPTHTHNVRAYRVAVATRAALACLTR